MPTFNGDSGDNTITGTTSADIINGLGGNDTIYGLDGDDTITGGTGNDVMEGDGGNDSYNYSLGDGDDRIFDHDPWDDYPADSINADDVLIFGTGVTLSNIVLERGWDDPNDWHDLVVTVSGQSGSIYLNNQHSLDAGIEIFRIASQDYGHVYIAELFVNQHETSGDDDIYGTNFDDNASGLAGADLIETFEGADTLTGGTGNDLLRGGDGADTYVYARGDGNDEISDFDSAGTEVDILSFASGIIENNVTVTWAVNGDVESYVLYLDGGAESVTLTNAPDEEDYEIEKVLFSTGAYWDPAQIAARVIDASNSADTIIGTAAAETLHGLGGDDQIEGRADNDVLFGDDGADVLLGEDGNDTLDGGSGSDQLTGGAGNDIYYVDVSGDAVTEASGGGTDLVYSKVTRTLGAEIENLTLWGGATINGTGNSLANVLTGNNAANILNGGAGADTMSGGDNHDTYIVDNAGDVVIESGSNGNDKVETSVTYTLPTHFEKLTLTGSANIDGTANSADNIILGNSGDNYLSAGSGDDTVDAGDGDDVIYGSNGDDVLTGGAGEDQFRFNVAPGTGNVDEITDFSVADDKIWLARYAFTVFEGVGSFGTGHFRAGTAAVDFNDYVIYDSATGNIYYDADGNGATAQILFATVDPGTSLTYADFGIYG